MLTPWKISYDKSRYHIEKQRHYFAKKGLPSQGYGFSSRHVWMWKLDCEESWSPKNWCFWTVVLEKTLESPLECKEIQPGLVKQISPRISLEVMMLTKAEIPVPWPPHVKSWLAGKISDAGRDWGQKEKGTTEYEMPGWHHWLNGRESEWTPGVGDGQGGLVCCDSWGREESDTTERLNWTQLKCSLQNWEKIIATEKLTEKIMSKICKLLMHLSTAAMLLQSCLTLCDPIDGSPPGSPVPGILQARTLEWIAISFSNAWKWKVKVKSLSGIQLLATPWTAAYQASLSMEFSRQEYWSGVPSSTTTSFCCMHGLLYFLYFSNFHNCWRL